MTRPSFRTLACRLALLLCTGAATSAAVADPVVVGRRDPATGTYITLENVLVANWLDGVPILKQRIGFSRVSNAWFLLRAGRGAAQGCRTEVFRLVEISGSRLAIADPTNPNLAWGVNPIPTKIYPTFDCVSFSCMDCLSSADGQGADTNLDEPHCVCNPELGASTQGECKTTQPGLGGPYRPVDLVIQTPKF